MRKFTALSTLFLLAMSSSATAATLPIEVVPNQIVHTGLEFDVKRRIDRDLEQSEFTIEIAAKNFTLPESADSWISMIEVKPSELSSRPSRDVNCTTEATKIRCAFTVSNQELQNPNLSFALSIPVRISRASQPTAMGRCGMGEEPRRVVQIDRNGESILMPSLNLLYFRLNDPQIQIVEESIDSRNSSTPSWNLFSAIEAWIRNMIS